MLKGYVKATADNIKVGQKCYVLNKPSHRGNHFIKPKTFGVIAGNLKDYDWCQEFASVEVDGRWLYEDKFNYFEPVNQTIYLENLLVKVDK